MKAVYCPIYGSPSVLESREIEEPAISDSEILIRTCATTVTTGDCRVRALRMPIGFGLIGRLALGLQKPRQPILGSELSGIVVAIGKNVTKFKVGDEVVLYTGTKLGCHTEFKAVSQVGPVIPKPATMPFHEAAAMASSGTTALAFLRKGGVQQGSKVLIVGASGGVGSAAVMLAKHLGAHVTAVCSSKNAELVTTFGADRVIDYTKEDYTRSGAAYDVILDATGTLSYLGARALLNRNGRLLLVSATLPHILQSLLAALWKHKVIAGPAAWTTEDLRFLARAVESGEYRVPVDRIYSLEHIADAHGYVDAGRKRGNVVICMNTNSECAAQDANSGQGAFAYADPITPGSRNGEGISANLPRIRVEGAMPTI